MDPKTAVASAYCDTVEKIANDFGSCQGIIDMKLESTVIKRAVF
jgi:hypothetical protein